MLFSANLARFASVDRAGRRHQNHQHQRFFEPLEGRQLLAGITLGSDGILSIEGAFGQRNTMSVNPSGSSYVAKLNSTTKTFSASSVKTINIVGGDWNDTITISKSITRPSRIDGGAGNDLINGGGGPDEIYGGTLNDTIYGHMGNDTLSGGSGNDYIDAGSGTDWADGGAGSDTVKYHERSGTISAAPTNSAANVSAVEIWDAGTNQKVSTLNSGSTLDLSKLPAKWTLVAQGTGASVNFGLDSSGSYAVENVKPWSISGDNNGKLNAWSIGTGSHTLKVTPYTKSGASGIAGATKTFSFNVTSSGPVASGATVDKLELWNSSTNKFIETLTGGETIDLSKTPKVTIVAQGGAASMKFALDSNSNYRVESQAPFAIAGDFGGGDLADWNVSTGTHTVKVTPYTRTGAAGTAGASKSVTFNVIKSGSSTSGPSVAGATVDKLELWNSSTNKFIETLDGGETIDLSKTPKVTIVAQGAAGSVKFALDSNSNYRVENQKPWAIAGDFGGGDLADWNISTGSHTVKVTPYTKGSASGTAGASRSVSFSVIKSGSTSTGGSTGSTGGISPRNSSAASPDAVIYQQSSSNIRAGLSFHANAMSSKLNYGTPLTARYVWDFGDSGSKYNVLEGFNASHLYTKPGSYTVKLTVTNEAGKSDTATMTVNVADAGRKKIYVSSSGSDSNDGLSESRPIRTWDKARSKLTDNVEILFKGGNTFDVKSGINVYKRNVVFGSYGSGKATLKYSGDLNYSTVFWLGGGSGENTVRDLVFDSIYNGKDKMPQAIGIAGNDNAIVNNEFRHMGYAINANSQPDGLLIQDNTAPSTSSIRDYFLWVKGSDIAVIGNKVVNSVHEHILRSEGTDRILIAENDFANPSLSGEPWNKSTINLHKGSYHYVADNYLDDGTASVGPLGRADGLNDKGARIRYSVFENNTVDSEFMVLHGAEHTMLRNNLLRVNDAAAFEIDAYSGEYNRGVKDLTLVNNTVVNNGSAGNFIRVLGDADGINLVNNLYLAPKLVTGTNGSAPVFVYWKDLSMFNKITNNVWPKPTIEKYAEGGINYVWPNWSNASGYKTPGEWEAYGVVVSDYFEDLPFNSSTAAPTGGTNRDVGTVWAGVFTDMNGKIRSNSGDWTAGAIEV